MSDFKSLLHSDNERLAVLRLPAIGLAQAGRAGLFDDAGYPVSAGSGTIDFTNLGYANACAFKICGDSMELVYREGDIVIVFPTVAILPGDRAVAKTTRDEILAKELVKTSVNKVRLASINAMHSEIFLLRAEVV